MRDLIRRQDAIDAVEFGITYAKAINKETDEVTALFEKSDAELKEAANRIKSLPSADPKTGKWVMLERDENVHDIHGVPTWGINYMCDKCGFITTAIQDHFSQYKWCPSCGADMRKGGDAE